MQQTPFHQRHHSYEQTTSANLPSSTSAMVQGPGYLQPRISPSFGHGVEDLIFTAVTTGSMEGLGISHAPAYSTGRSTISNVSSPRMPASNKTAWYDPATMARGRAFTAPAPQTLPPTPQTAALPPALMSQPVAIAPQPSKISARPGMKRIRTDDHYESGRSPQRRRSNGAIQSSQNSASSKPQAELSEEDQLLLKLKHEENLPWKDIAREFEARIGRSYQVPALQMRHKRLRERLRTWTEGDVSALEAAYEYYEKSKFEIVAQKVRPQTKHCKKNLLTGLQMLEFGAQEKWPAKYCERKWEELHPESLGAHSGLQAPMHSGGLPLGSSAPSHDNWISQDHGSELEFGQSPPAIQLLSRSPVTFATSVLSHSPGQRSPVSIHNEVKLES